MELTVAILLCLGGLVNGEKLKLMCSDWQGKLISPGVQYYPKAEDPCYKCFCGEKGSANSCMTVSCAPPTCALGYRTVSGKCCQFECTEAGDNTTGLTPPKVDVTGKATEDSMTDLGLRLVASTVTTFLILAVLLVLIHRLRQRRLLVALRRYGHRREHLDDSDNISYSPEYFGIQCPPYVDPPPPYTLPKPPYYPPGEQPPPYEEVVENGPENQGNQLVDNRNQPGNPRTGSAINGNHSNGSRENNANTSLLPSMNNAVNNGVNISSVHMGGNSSPVRESRNGVIINGRERSNLCNNSNNSSQQNEGVAGTERHSGIVHFRNSSTNGGGQLNITMGIQNRGRNNRNRFSDSQFSVTQSRNAHTRNLNLNQINGLNLEIRNAFNNLRPTGNCIPLQPMRAQQLNTSPGGNISSSSTDIGESSTSAESLESSPNYTPESPDMDEDRAVSSGTHDVTDDADLAVKQFMDRQFGPMSRIRRYPTTMSQSWTSAQLGSVGTPNFSHSISLGSFLPNQDNNGKDNNDNIGEERSGRRNGNALAECKNVDNQLLRSKSEQLKTNGSLKSPPFKGIVRSHTTTSNLPMPQTGFGARVSYVESDELSHLMNGQRRAKSGDFSHFQRGASSQDNIDSNISECSSSSHNATNLSIRNLDPDKIIVSKRQDLLRELRLSHLLQHPDHHANNSNLMKVSNLEADPSQLSNREHNNDQGIHNSAAGSAISNDAHYPDNSYRKTLRNMATSGQSPARGEDTSPDHSDRSGLPQESVSDTSSLISNNESSKNSTPVKSLKNKVKEMNSNSLMSQSWHGNNVHSCEENMSGRKPGTDTLGRNSNTHFDKKVGDKDVSNLFFPQFKPLYDGERVRSKDVIPSSDMRACAAQMYNCETEERSSKKGKRKHLHKRHSAGCFPTKREPVVQSNQQSSARPKLSHKIKSFHGNERPMGHRYSDSHHDNIKGHHSDKIVKHSSDDPEPEIADLMPPYLYHTNLPSPMCLVSPKVDQNGDNVQPCDLTSDRNAVYPSRSQKRRSKSLGRIENVRSPEKKAESSSGRRQQSRSKKSLPLPSGKINLLNDDIMLDRNNVSESTTVKSVLNGLPASVSRV